MSNFAPLQHKRTKKTPSPTPYLVLQSSRDFAPPAMVPNTETVPFPQRKQFGYSIGNLAIHRPEVKTDEEVVQQAISPTGQQTPSTDGTLQLQQETQAAYEAGISEQRQENHTGLPDALKAGVERLSGYSLSDIRVHYNSPSPAEVDALAYTQGTEIHVGPGQEEHLAHEAWHVVQQKQGRVQPTLQAKSMAINDDPLLEAEANQMGLQAANHQTTEQVEMTTTTVTPDQLDTPLTLDSSEQDTIQRVGTGTIGFAGLKNPTGYGSVSLQATLNGTSLGDAWSKKTTYAEDTEHAEDALIDYIETLESAAMFPGNAANWVEDPTHDIPLAQSLQNGKVLVINNLTASPCSTARGTNKKTNFDGCAERLIELAGRGFQITVNANHYYQPQGVQNAKQQSIQACADMSAVGITVNIANP